MASEYRLTGRLEGGELAELYRAEKVGGPPVVVKLFHTRTTNAAYAREIADTQNRLLKLTNPGIAQVLDIGLVKSRLAIVREDRGRFTLGMALQRLNTKEIVITPALAMALVINLLEAVADAHGTGVVHGALTPGNVLLSDAGQASICDFGALAALNAVPALRKNFAGRGRSSYRAPEVSQGEGLSVQADIYSLGAMTYELLTLKEPSTGSAAVSVRREQLPPPSRLDRRLNSRFDPIVLRALDQSPGRRYKSAIEFISALRELLTYTGGMPGREELAKFTTQLFPNDVQILEPSGNVPFESAFSLSAVDGASLEEADERSMVVADRKSFSGGTLDDMEAVSIPVDHNRATQQMTAIKLGGEGDRQRETDWHAPPAAMPATARSGPKETANSDVLKRVKRIEDFGAMSDDTQPVGAPIVTPLDVPKAFPGRAEERAVTKVEERPMSREERAAEKAKHVATPAESGPITGENVIVVDGKKRRMITEERNVVAMEKAAKRWVPLVVGSALLALAFLFLGLWKWSSGEDLQTYVAPPAPPRPRSLPVVKQPHVERAQERPPPTKNCYTPPLKNFGFIGVASDRPIWVKVEGEYVCGSHQKVPVTVGTRSIAVVDSRTGEEYVTPVRIDLNRVAPVVPTFKGR
jgi:serine/threonine-protein kinase